MGEVVDLIDKVKRYYWFTPSELRGLIITTLVLAFVISFREWGGVEFNFAVGFSNFLIAVLIVGVSLLIHTSGQRVWSLAAGYRLEYQMWGLGLFLAVIFAFITNGRFWFLVAGGFMVHHLAGHRLGWFRYDIGYWGIALIALSGSLITVLFIIVLKISNSFLFAPILQKLIIFNIVYTVYNMIPIPPLDGAKIFYGSRMAYAFYLPGIIAIILLLYADIPILFAVLGSFLVALVLWLLYYIFLERHLWAPDS